MALKPPTYRFDHIEKFLQKNYLNTYTIEQLVEEGLGTPATIFYRLNKSRYVTKVKKGHYRFTAWYVPSAKTGQEVVMELLKENPLISMDTLIEKTKLNKRTINSILNRLRKEGKVIDKVICYQLKPEKE